MSTADETQKYLQKVSTALRGADVSDKSATLQKLDDVIEEQQFASANAHQEGVPAQVFSAPAGVKVIDLGSGVGATENLAASIPGAVALLRGVKKVTNLAAKNEKKDKKKSKGKNKKEQDHKMSRAEAEADLDAKLARVQNNLNAAKDDISTVAQEEANRLGSVVAGVVRSLDVANGAFGGTTNTDEGAAAFGGGDGGDDDGFGRANTVLVEQFPALNANGEAIIPTGEEGLAQKKKDESKKGKKSRRSRREHKGNKKKEDRKKAEDPTTAALRAAKKDLGEKLSQVQSDLADAKRDIDAQAESNKESLSSVVNDVVKSLNIASKQLEHDNPDNGLDLLEVAPTVLAAKHNHVEATALAEKEDGDFNDDAVFDAAPVAADEAANELSHKLSKVGSDLQAAAGNVAQAGETLAGAAGDISDVGKAETAYILSSINGVTAKLAPELGMPYSCGDTPCYEVLTYIVLTVCILMSIWVLCLLWGFFINVFWAVIGCYVVYICYELLQGPGLSGLNCQLNAQYQAAVHYSDVIAGQIINGIAQAFPGLASTYQASGGGDLSDRVAAEQKTFDELSPYDQGVVVGFFVFVGFCCVWNCCCRTQSLRKVNRDRLQALLKADTDLPEEEETDVESGNAVMSRRVVNVSNDENHVETEYTRF